MDIQKLKAVSHPFRKHVIEQLAFGNLQATGDLKGDFKMTKAAVSQHLKILRDSHMILESKIGRSKVYSLNPVGIKEVYQWAENFEAFWSEKLGSLNSYLETKHGKD